MFLGRGVSLGLRSRFASCAAASLFAGGVVVSCQAPASFASKAERPEHHRILIVGGGSAGLGVAAQLRNRGERDIAVIEPSDTHYYQPLWTLVGGGLNDVTETKRPMAKVMPKEACWIKESVMSFQPTENAVTLGDGRRVTYDCLVVAAGLQLNWNKVKGLKEAIVNPDEKVVSIYSYETAEKTKRMLQGLKGGKLVFTQPNTPIKCGGAPQKIMWLTEDKARREGIRDKFDITFIIPQKVMFTVKKYSDILNAMREERGVAGKFEMELVEVDTANNTALFKAVDGSGQEERLKFDVLHVVPPMSAPDAISNSPLANAAGYVDVDKHTLQHTKYSNVFAVGDCSSLPTSKTIAAITSQAPVVTHNIMQQLQGKPLTAKYDGYTSCPIVTGRRSLLLAEFTYDGAIKESFAKVVDQGKPHYAFMLMKQYIFPAAYWHLFLRGHWFGARGPFRPKFE